MATIAARAMAKDGDGARADRKTAASTGLAALGALLFVLADDPSGAMVAARPSTALFLALLTAQVLAGTGLADRLEGKRQDD